MARPALNVENFSSEKNFIQSAVRLIKSVCENSTDVIRIALSGGSTPQKTYAAMASATLPFKRIEIYMVDERFVPLEHPDSNCLMVKQALKNVKARLHGFFYFDTNLSPKKCAEDYEEKIKGKIFDLVILGIGPDGHTASLFPDSEALKEKNPVALTETESFKVKKRITLTFPPILKSKKILVLLKGIEKAAILKKLADPKVKTKEFPAKQLLKHPDLQVYFCR